jgi:hypothetical protein
MLRTTLVILACLTVSFCFRSDGPIAAAQAPKESAVVKWEYTVVA